MKWSLLGDMLVAVIGGLISSFIFDYWQRRFEQKTRDAALPPHPDLPSVAATAEILAGEPGGHRMNPFLQVFYFIFGVLLTLICTALLVLGPVGEDDAPSTAYGHSPGAAFGILVFVVMVAGSLGSWQAQRQGYFWKFWWKILILAVLYKFAWWGIFSALFWGDASHYPIPHQANVMLAYSALSIIAYAAAISWASPTLLRWIPIRYFNRTPV